jgi:hypothetical protein
VPLPTDSLTALSLSFVEGTHGQDLLNQGEGRMMLRLAGELLTALQQVPIDLFGEKERTPSNVFVHGDFGPQNLLVDVSRRK